MLAVVRRNPKFRRIWLSQVVSQLGDWLNRVALLGLITDVGDVAKGLGLGLLLGLELAVRFLPSAFFGPIAGPLADRLPRRRILIASDLLRAVVVLGFMLVDSSSELVFVYLLLLAQMGLGIFFDAARSAAIPSTVAKEDLHAAYALSAATWSAMLTIGAATGAIVVESIGTRSTFAVDSATYILSALFLVGVRLAPPARSPAPLEWRDIVYFRDLRRALRHARDVGVAPIVFAKAFWGGAGGFLVFLPIAAEVRYSGTPVAEGVAFATGVLYAARGLGTGVGPLASRRLFGSTDRSLRRQVLGGFVIGALGYSLFAVAPTLGLGFACVVFAHLGGSTLWVGSTVLWQKHVGDEFRGRVYALESLGMTISFSLGGLAGGYVFDVLRDLTPAVLVVCGVVAVCGAWWGWLSRSCLNPRGRVHTKSAKGTRRKTNERS